MRGQDTRYFVGFFVTILLLIALILLLISGGGHKKPLVTPRLLNSYASTDAQVQLTIDGPINAPQSHQQIQIIVDNTQAIYQQVQGYDGQVVNTRSFSNTQNSYYAFLSALMQANFTKGKTLPGSNQSDTGLCPAGDRYDVSLTQDGQTLEHYWATNCGGTTTYQGNLSLTLQLFQAQIPKYGDLSASVSL